MIENRKINIILDADGNRLVLINDIVFKGKRNINWDEVKTYLEQYVGDYYEIEESSEKYTLAINFRTNIQVQRAKIIDGSECKSESKCCNSYSGTNSDCKESFISGKQERKT